MGRGYLLLSVWVSCTIMNRCLCYTLCHLIFQISYSSLDFHGMIFNIPIKLSTFSHRNILFHNWHIVWYIFHRIYLEWSSYSHQIIHILSYSHIKQNLFHIPDARRTVYLPTFTPNKSPSFVGKYTRHGASPYYYYSIDWFKGKITGKSHCSWENLWFPVKLFPFLSTHWIIHRLSIDYP